MRTQSLGRSILNDSTLGVILLAVIPSLLYAPILYYSLTTPFALTDDLSDWVFINRFDNPSSFMRELMDRTSPDFSDPDKRFRIFWELYNALAWKSFGATPRLHHLSRWILHFGAVFTFVAAVRCLLFLREEENPAVPAECSRTSYLLPLVFLVYIWIFFPNTPASRLSCQEVYTVFFLGLCNWMMALILSRKGKQKRTSSILPQLVILHFGYLGLCWSKETNIAPALYILLFYCVFLTSGDRLKKVAALPMVLIFFHALVMVYLASMVSDVGYGEITDPLPFRDNATELYEGLFQVDTSALITYGFSILSVTLLFFLLSRIVKRRADSEILFILLLLGQFLSSFSIFGLSYGVTLRCWYPLVPLFATLLAFSLKFILEFAEGRSRIFVGAARGASASFLILFVAVNYYNFSFQTVIQHSLRNTDSRLISEITRLVDQGEYVRIEETGSEPADNLIHSVGPFLKHFYGNNYKIYTDEPEAGRQYYFVTRRNLPIVENDPLMIPNREDYLLLSYASRIAEYIQGEPPLAIADAGVQRVINYQWKIYSRISGEPQILTPSESDELLMTDLSSGFDLYLNRNENSLLYFKEPCREKDTHIDIDLRVFPAEPDLFPAKTEIGNFFLDHRRRYGYDTLVMDFKQYGMLERGKCAVVRKLPAYDIDQIRTQIYSR